MYVYYAIVDVYSNQVHVKSTSLSIIESLKASYNDIYDRYVIKQVTVKRT